MSGTYVSRNGIGEFEVRPFQLESICQANAGHSHHYDHWMRINRGGIRLEIREPSKWQVTDPEGRIEPELYDWDKPVSESAAAEGYVGKEIEGKLLSLVDVYADHNKPFEVQCLNGETVYFHLFVDAKLWHKVKCLANNTQYDCCFQHRDFDTGEVVQSYNGNLEAAT